MSILNIPDEEKAAIRKQHEEATKNFYLRKNEIKGGIKKPEKKEEPKKEEPKKEEPKKEEPKK